MKLTKITEIKENPTNPRIIKDSKFEKLVESIREFPEMMNLRPIVVNRDNVIIGGNMRFAACKFLGKEEIMVITADEFTSEQEKEFEIKDNVSFGDWDWDELSSNWDSKNLNDFGLEVWLETEQESPDFHFDEDEDEDDDTPKPTGEFKTETPERYLEVICPNCATLFNVKA